MCVFQFLDCSNYYSLLLQIDCGHYNFVEEKKISAVTPYLVILHLLVVSHLQRYVGSIALSDPLQLYCPLSSVIVYRLNLLDPPQGSVVHKYILFT